MISDVKEASNVRKALLLIDLSNDFIRIDGALNCGPAGEAIIPYCAALTQSFLTEGAVVLDARDNHTMDDYEIASGLFPPHNLNGTFGQALVDPLVSVLTPHESNWIRVPKKHYNAMYQTRLPEILQEMNVDELHIVGVCTDICVRYTLNGLYEFKTAWKPNLELIVHQRGVASFSEEGHLDTLRHIPMAFGAKIV